MMSDYFDRPNRLPITLCVINHEGEEHLRANLPALVETSDLFDEVMMVDNGSTDKSSALFRAAFPSADVIRMTENRGPGSARNAGFRTAANDRILFVDNDVRVGPGTAGPLMAALDDNDRAVLAVPRVLYGHDPGRIQYEGADSHITGHMIPRRTGLEAAACPGGPSRVNSLVSACFLVDRNRWGPETLFDETLFFNYEDRDLGVRARVFGFDIVAVPASEVRHGTGTPGLSYRPGGEYASRRISGLLLGRWHTILKNYRTRSLLRLFPLLLVYETALLAGAIRKGWWREWRTAFAGFMSNQTHLRSERKRIQSKRRTEDHDIFEAGPFPYTIDLVRTPVERGARGALEHAFSAYWKWTCRHGQRRKT